MKKLILVMLAVLATGVVSAEFVGAEEEKMVDLGKVFVESSTEDLSIGINEYSMSNAVFRGGAVALGSDSNVADLFENVPGVYYVKSGVINSGAGIYAPHVFKIRGLGGTPNTGVLTIIDDRPQSMAVWRHALLDTIPLDALESVELIKGPSSVQFGNQAAAGAINIKTRKMEKDGMKTTMGVMAGNYYTQDYFVNNIFKSGSIDYTASAGYKSTAGHRPNSDSYQQNYRGSAGYAFNDRWRAEINGGYAAVRAYNPGPEGEIWVREQEAVNTIQRDADIRIENKEIDCRGKIIFYTDSGYNKFLVQATPLGVTIPGSDNRYENYGARIMREWNILPGNMIKLGFDWQYFGGYFENHPPMPAMKKSEESHENDYAPYFVVYQKVGMMEFSAGARYGFNSRWDDEFIPQAGFNVSAWEGHKLYFSASKGYRTPAMGTVIFAEFDELKPESFWQYEAGMKHEAGEMFNYSLGYFQTEGSNMLITDPVDSILKNTGLTLIRGVEASAGIKFFDAIKAGTSISYIDPKNKTAGVVYLSGSSFVEAVIGDSLNLKLEAEYGHDRFDADDRDERLADYFIINAGINYKAKVMGVDSDFYINIDNIADKKYEIKKGYPSPGFLIKGGMVVRI